MHVITQPGRDDGFETSSWRSNDWITILHTLRKELKAAASVFPDLKDYVIERPQAAPAPPTPKKRGK